MIDADLKAYCGEMAECNGLALGKYLNAVLEKGVFADLREAGYTDDSIHKFVNDLRANKKPNWSILKMPTGDINLTRLENDIRVHGKTSGPGWMLKIKKGYKFVTDLNPTDGSHSFQRISSAIVHGCVKGDGWTLVLDPTKTD